MIDMNFLTMDESDYAALVGGIREYGRRAALDRQMDALFHKMNPDVRENKLRRTKQAAAMEYKLRHMSPREAYKEYIRQYR